MTTILCVDDDRGILDLLEALLTSSMDARVLKAGSVTEAMGILTSGRVDLVISDYEMGHCSGLDLLGEIRARGDAVPFILFTGKGREDVAIEALNMGADFYLQKGGDAASQFAQLLHFISVAMERRANVHQISIQRDMMAAINDSIIGFIESNDVHSTFGSLLYEIGKMVGVDRAYIFRNHLDDDGRLLMSQEAEWVGPGIVPQIDNPLLQDLPYDDSSPDLSRILDRGETYLRFVEDLTGSEREILESQGITSLAIIPIFVGDRWWGFVGFDDCRGARDWLDVEMFALQTAARVMGQMIRSDEVRTELTAAESSYRSLYKMMRLMCDNMPDLIWAKDDTGNYIFINSSGANYLFRTADAEEPIGKDNAFYSRREGEMREYDPQWKCFWNKADDMDRRVLEEGRPIRYEQVRSGGAGDSYLEVFKAPLLDDDGEVIGTVGTGRDVSVLRRALKELERNREMIDVTMAGARMCAWEYDVDSDRLTVNSGSSILLPRESLRPWRLRDMLDGVAPESRTELGEAIERLGSGSSELEDVVSMIMDVGGETRWVRTLSKPVKGSGPKRLVGINVDVTEIQRSKEGLLEANRKLNILTDITRHDILNQVAIIQGYNRLLLDSEAINGKEKQMMEKILQATKNVQELVTMTEDYQELGVHSPGLVSLSKTIDEVSKSYADRLEVSSDVDGIEIFADPLFPKVFSNLMENAIWHGGASSMRISICEGDPLRIMVEDNGKGIPLEDKTRIFAKGYGKNTGFGLFLSREILGITGMDISETGEEGSGARFEITVPDHSS